MLIVKLVEPAFVYKQRSLTLHILPIKRTENSERTIVKYAIYDGSFFLIKIATVSNNTFEVIVKWGAVIAMTFYKLTRNAFFCSVEKVKLCIWSIFRRVLLDTWMQRSWFNRTINQNKQAIIFFIFFAKFINAIDDLFFCFVRTWISRWIKFSSLEIPNKNY